MKHKLLVQNMKEVRINSERDRMIDLLNYLQSNGTWEFGNVGKVVDQYIDSLCEKCEGEGWVYRDSVTSVKIGCDCEKGHRYGTLENSCEHEIEKLYNKIGDYKADYCIKCKGLY